MFVLMTQKVIAQIKHSLEIPFEEGVSANSLKSVEGVFGETRENLSYSSIQPLVLGKEDSSEVFKTNFVCENYTIEEGKAEIRDQGSTPQSMAHRADGYTDPLDEATISGTSVASDRNEGENGEADNTISSDKDFTDSNFNWINQINGSSRSYSKNTLSLGLNHLAETTSENIKSCDDVVFWDETKDQSDEQPPNCFGGNDGSIRLQIDNSEFNQTEYTFYDPNGNVVPKKNRFEIENLISGTYRVVAKTSIKGGDGTVCTYETTITVPEAEQRFTVNTSSAVTDESCDGNDGKIDLEITGANDINNVTYDWTDLSGTDNPQDRTELAAGDYEVRIVENTDGVEHCEVYKFTVNPFIPIAIESATVTNSSCSGANNGRIDLTVQGGIGPLSYSWTKDGVAFGENKEDLTGLNAGTYEVIITDTRNCQFSGKFTISEPSDLGIAVNDDNKQDVSCNGGNDGKITIPPPSAINGDGNFIYEWSHDNSLTTNEATGLEAGTYTVKISDSADCQTITITIKEPETLNIINESNSNITCHGANDGSINMAITGGTAPYSYAWTRDSQAFGQTTEDLSGLSPGIYQLTITDAKSCKVVSSEITIEEPDELNISNGSISNITCHGANNGSINMTITGGTGSYSYSWTKDNQAFGQATKDLSSLSPGVYQLTVKDTNNCSVTSSEIIIEEPDELIITSSTTDAGCDGGTNGAIEINVSGGAGGYGYTWSGPSEYSNTTEDISNIGAGNYTVTVTDANGCVKTQVIAVNEDSGKSLTEQIDDNICHGGSAGAIELTVNGASSNLVFTWTGPNGYTADSKNISGLAAGNYQVTVLDKDSNCTIVGNFDVTEPEALTVALSKTDVSCAGQSDGSITFNLSGGTGDYDISVDPSTLIITVTDDNNCVNQYRVSTNDPAALANASFDVSTKRLNGLAASTFEIFKITGQGNILISTQTITEPSAITANAAVDNVKCNGGNDGSITLAPQGGSGSYTYAWADDANVKTAKRSNLSAGSYTVTITDGKGCTLVQEVIVSEPDPLALTEEATSNVTCKDGQNGSINVVVSGGSTPYTYAWTGPSSFSSSAANISNLSAGTYELTVTDNNNCQITKSYAITEPEAISLANISVTDASCKGRSNGVINLSVTGGTAPYTYEWSNNSTTNEPSLSGLAAGTYSVVIRDANQCTFTANDIVVSEPNSSLTATANPTDVKCFGQNDGEISLTLTNAVEPVTYLWSNEETSSSVSGLGPGTYSVEVTDANGCIVVENITIEEPNALIVELNKTAITCSGANDGKLTATVQGGTAPYSYAWSNESTEQNLTGLSAGTYTLTITDANGCTVEASASLTDPDEINVVPAKKDVTCENGNDGEIDITVSGGLAPYTYTWSNGETTEDIDELPAGTYTVDITDARGCQTNLNVTILEPNSGIEASATVTDINCKGSADGAISLSVAGGQPPYSFLWSNESTSKDISGLSAGTYSVTISDVNNCYKISGITVSEPAAELLISGEVQDISCQENNDGEINITVSGGTAPYVYQWSNGSANQDQNGLSDGTYTVTVTDNNGCTSEASFTINRPEALNLTTTAIPVSCHSGSNGSIDLSIQGGTAPYNIVWSNGKNTEDLVDLAAGTYRVVVTDDRGCSASIETTVDQPETLQASSAVTNATCNGGTDGAIDLKVEGGTSPYQFSWSNGQTTEDLSNIPLGNYTVTITDANNCSLEKVISVNEAGNFSLSVESNSVSCIGNSDGSLNLTVANGTAPFTYNWSNGQTAEDISDLSPGTYSVVVADASGCKVTLQAKIEEPEVINAEVSKSDISCFGLDDGTISLAISGGTENYTIGLAVIPNTHIQVTAKDLNNCQTATFLVQGDDPASTNSVGWSVKDNVLSIDGLAEGTYQVLHVEQGNQIIGTASIASPTPLTVTPTIRNLNCNGANDGKISLSVSGGSGTYTYEWDNQKTTREISGLSAGIYRVIIRDSNGCQLPEQSFEITAPLPIETNATTEHIKCPGAQTGSIAIQTTGGLAPYTYSWSNGATRNNIENLSPGNYTVQITDANGCSISQSFEIRTPEVITVDESITPVQCHQEANGAITVSAKGGTAPYSYQWSTGDSGATIDQLTAGFYQLILTDANNCSQTFNYEVTEPEALTAEVVQTLDIDCETRTVEEEVTIIASGGKGQISYNWNEEPTFISDNNRAFRTEGIQQIRIKDANNCTIALTVNTVLPELGTVSIGIEESTTDPFGNYTLNTPITFAASLSDNVISHQWDLGDGTSSDAQSFDHVYPDVGDYVVTLTATDDNGCTTSTTMDLTVNLGYEILMPTAFTPNGDNLNDRLYPETYGLVEMKMIIYNNWGDVVFVSESMESGGWNGMVNNEEAPAGGYAYKLFATSISGKEIEKAGSFLLIKN